MKKLKAYEYGMDVVQTAMQVQLGGSKELIKQFAGTKVTEHKGDLVYTSGDKLKVLKHGDILIKNPYTNAVQIIAKYRPLE